MGHKLKGLLGFLRACTQEQREYAAAHAGTSVGYLYQLACGSRELRKANFLLVARLIDASEKLHKQTNGHVVALTTEDLT